MFIVVYTSYVSVKLEGKIHARCSESLLICGWVPSVLFWCHFDVVVLSSLFDLFLTFYFETTVYLLESCGDNARVFLYASYRAFLSIITCNHGVFLKNKKLGWYSTVNYRVHSHHTSFLPHPHPPTFSCCPRYQSRSSDSA